jgi:hypothetical protein
VQAVAGRGTTVVFHNLVGDGRGVAATGEAGPHGAEEKRGWTIEADLGRVMVRARGCAMMNLEPKEVDPGDARSRDRLPHFSAKGRPAPVTARYEQRLTERSRRTSWRLRSIASRSMPIRSMSSCIRNTEVSASFAPSNAPRSFSSGVSSTGGESSSLPCLWRECLVSTLDAFSPFGELRRFIVR